MLYHVRGVESAGERWTQEGAQTTDLPQRLKLWFMLWPILFFVLFKAPAADKAQHNDQIRGTIGDVPETCSVLNLLTACNTALSTPTTDPW